MNLELPRKRRVQVAPSGKHLREEHRLELQAGHKLVCSYFYRWQSETSGALESISILPYVGAVSEWEKANGQTNNVMVTKCVVGQSFFLVQFNSSNRGPYLGVDMMTSMFSITWSCQLLQGGQARLVALAKNKRYWLSRYPIKFSH